jgi:hypothetical protein
MSVGVKERMKMRKCMESAAIGGEMRIRKRVLVSCAVAKAGRPTKILVNSRTIRPTVMAVPNQSSTGGKGIWAAETKGRALSFAAA